MGYPSGMMVTISLMRVLARSFVQQGMPDSTIAKN